MATLTASPSKIAGAWSRSHKAPLWVSLALHALALADADGHTECSPGALAYHFGVTASDVSRAITRAVQAGWLHPVSTSRCLVLADA